MYLAQNKLLSTKTVICKVETLAEKYILLDSLLFILVTTPKKETTLLSVPEMCAAKTITLYHSSLFAGHQGVIKCIWPSKISSSYQDWYITYNHI